MLACGIEKARQLYADGRYGLDSEQARANREVVGSALPFAHALLHRGDAESVQQAAAIVRSVLEMQERHPRHAHRGNWPRFVGDEEVTDLNSAPFVLLWLLPLLVSHAPQLPAELVDCCRESVHLALDEEERLDVQPTYTNIHLMSLFALIVGGEWLEDAHFQQVGKARWSRWCRFTVASGAPREYNSPIYLSKDLTVLGRLHEYTCEPAIRLQARLLYERFWLHAVLHIHAPTHQLAGPHSRCYWEGMTTGQERFKDVLWRETGWAWTRASGPYGERPASGPPASLDEALTDHWLPTFARTWLEKQTAAMPYEVRETASATEGYDLTTYFTPAYALGTASRTYSTGTGILAIEQMANHFMVHYARLGEPGGWGMAYSRYVVNDRHLGTLGSFPFRPKTNFFDQGHFASAQSGNKAICLYALLPQYDTYVTSLKTVIAFQSGHSLQRVWVNDQPVQPYELGGSLHPTDWVIVEDGAVFIAIRPLEPSCLGRDTPILFERGPLGELFLSIYNYRGPAKRFWEYASLGGAYWRGNLRAGFIVEVADRTDCASAPDFLGHLRQTTVEDAVGDDFIRTVTYRSGQDEIALSYDLWNTQPRERRFNGRVYQPPNLQSPLGVQGNSGELRVGGACLRTNPQQVWLIAQELDPAQRAWIAVNPEDRPTPLRLETPCGVIAADAWGMGSVTWQAPVGGEQIIVIDALEEPVGLRVPAGIRIVRQQEDARWTMD